MNPLLHKPLSEMTSDEALDCCAERAAMKALLELGASDLLDNFEGRDIVELRRQLETSIRVTVKEAIRTTAFMNNLIKE